MRIEFEETLPSFREPIPQLVQLSSHDCNRKLSMSGVNRQCLNFSLLRPNRETNEQGRRMDQSSGFQIILLTAPSQRLFGTSGMSCRRRVEGNSTKRLSSLVTAARQRRTFTGLPVIHPQPSRCLVGRINYSRNECETQ